MSPDSQPNVTSLCRPGQKRLPPTPDVADGSICVVGILPEIGPWPDGPRADTSNFS